MKLSGLPSALGNLLTVLILLAADLASFFPKALAYGAVGLIDFATGSGKNTVRAKVPWHAQRFATRPVMAPLPAVGAGFGELDVPRTFAASTFPLKPDVLIAKAKTVLAAEFGTLAGSDPDALLSDDFQFVAPIVGPLGKREFLNAFGSFKVKDPDPNPNPNPNPNPIALTPTLTRARRSSRPGRTRAARACAARTTPPTTAGSTCG